MKKLFAGILILLVVIVGSALGLWYWLNYYFIPEKVIPEAQKQIAEFNKTSPVKFSIKNIFYLPYKGFQLSGISLVLPGRGVFLQARQADIDLDYLALLQQKLVISQIAVSGAILDVDRDRRGEWNFSSLLKIQPLAPKKTGKSFFQIEKIEVLDGVFDFNDQFKPANRLKRRFTDINLEITNPGEQYYQLHLSGSQSGEGLDLTMMFDAASQTLSAKGKFNTKYLGEYWAYYLDDVFHPWQLAAAEVAGEIDLAYGRKKLTANNHFTLKNAELAYGDTILRGEVEILQRQKGSSLEADIHVQKAAVYADRELILKNSDAVLILNNKKLVFKKIHGWLGDQPVYLTGEFRFSRPGELYLTGKINDTFHTLGAKIFSDQRGVAELTSRAGQSNLELRADVYDLKELAMNLTVNGELIFPTSGEVFNLSIELGNFEASGRIGFSGRLTGQLDELDSLDGSLKVRADYRSSPDNRRRNLNFFLTAKDGVFTGQIPTVDFFNGTLEGRVKFDATHWGSEVHFQELELARFAELEPKMAGTKGKFDGNLTLVGEWRDWTTLRGGGYFDVTDCSLKNAPIFADAAQGMASVTKGVEFPDFDKLVGNFEVASREVNFTNVFAHAMSLDLSLSGQVNFAGEADVTAGVKLNAGFYTRLRQLLLPFTIGFDLAKGAIRIKITGDWPNYDQQTKIEKINWLDQFYGTKTEADPDRYSLDSIF